ncbi:MAG: hypothetical protein ABI690_29635 [Chloroflexota bacterium]
MTETFQDYVSELNDEDRHALQEELAQRIERDEDLLKEGKIGQAQLLGAMVDGQTVGQFLAVEKRRFLFYPRLSDLADSHGEIKGWAMTYMMGVVYGEILGEQVLAMTMRAIKLYKHMAAKHKNTFGDEEDSDIDEVMRDTVDAAKRLHSQALKEFAKKVGMGGGYDY